MAFDASLFTPDPAPTAATNANAIPFTPDVPASNSLLSQLPYSGTPAGGSAGLTLSNITQPLATPDNALLTALKAIPNGISNGTADTFDFLAKMGGGISHVLTSAVNTVLPQSMQLPPANVIPIRQIIGSVNNPWLTQADITANPQAAQYGNWIGGVLSSIPGYAAGGAALSGVRSLAEDAPVIGNIAKYLGSPGLGGAMGRALGNAGYGVAVNPANPLAAAVMGVGGSVASDILGGGLSPSVNPEFQAQQQAYDVANAEKNQSATEAQKTANDLLSQLGNGNDIDQNAAELSNRMQLAYDMTHKSAVDQFNTVLKSPAGSINLYPPAGTDYLGSPVPNYDLQPLKKQLQSVLPAGSSSVVDDFINNPTLENGHWLQSTLGKELGDYAQMKAAGNYGAVEKNAVAALSNAQKTVSGKIDDALNNYDAANGTNTVNQYQDAQQNWKDTVVPLQQTPGIKNVVLKNQPLKAASITSTFQGAPNNPAVSQMLSDMGPAANSNILYNELAKSLNDSQFQDPNAIAKVTQSFNKKQLGSLVAPDIQALKDQLIKQNQAANIKLGSPPTASTASLSHAGTGSLGGFGLGAYLASHFGLGAENGGLLGAALGGSLPHFLSNPVVSKISAMLAPAYPAIGNTLRANLPYLPGLSTNAQGYQ